MNRTFFNSVVVTVLAWLFLSQSVMAEVVDYVEPVDWSRFDAAVELSANEELLSEAMQHFDKDLLTNHRAKFVDMPRTEEGYLDFWNRDVHRDTKVREPAYMAAALAVSMKTGVYDETLTGMTESEAKAFALDLLTSVAGTHKTNDPDGWGNDWQSSLWATEGARAAWQLWDDLEPVDQANVARMVEHEANRYNNSNPQEANGSLKNTYGEDNSWVTSLLDIASSMMPSHPNALTWLNQSVAYRLSAAAVPGDMDSDEVMHGRPVSEWVDGYNVFEEGYVVNHNQVPSPIYTAAVLKQKGNGATIYALSARDIPFAVVHNMGLMYGNFEHDYPSPPFAEPGGRIYRDDGTLYWPDAEGRGSSRAFSYYVYACNDTLARTLISYEPQNDWENLHWNKVRFMQENPDEPNASATNTGSNAAHATAIAWLAAWLDKQGAITITNEPLSAYLPDIGPASLDQSNLMDEGNLRILEGATINQRGEIGTLYYGSSGDLIPVEVLAYRSDNGGGGVLVPNGEGPPVAGQRGALLDGDAAINTGLVNIADTPDALVVEFAEPLVNGPGVEILIAELDGDDGFRLTGKDGAETHFETTRHSLHSTGLFISFHGGQSYATLEDLESAESFPAVRHAMEREVKFLVVDLSELGFGPNETLQTLSLRSAAGKGADPLLILGIPTWRHDFSSYLQKIEDPALRTAEHDGDGDGATNLKEYAENRDAANADFAVGVEATLSADDRLVIRFLRQAGKPDVLYRVLFSSTVQAEGWETAYRSDIDGEDIDRATWETVIDPHGTSATHSQRYGMLEISLRD